MSRYLSITKIVILESLQYRVHFISTFFGNMLYLGIVYYVWKAIFDFNNKDVINGMTFSKTFLYVALAHAILSLMGTLIDGEIARHILTGEISNILTQPVKYIYRMFYHNLGLGITNFIIIFVPTLIIIFGISNNSCNLVTVLCFLLSIFLGHIINFLVDYITGVTVFFTGNIWGIRGVKDGLMTLLSGLLIPIPYFPDTFSKVIKLLPFQAIYNVPIEILVKNGSSLSYVLTGIEIQGIWVVLLAVISHLEYKSLYKRLSVNGG